MDFAQSCQMGAPRMMSSSIKMAESPACRNPVKRKGLTVGNSPDERPYTLRYSLARFTSATSLLDSWIGRPPGYEWCPPNTLPGAEKNLCGKCGQALPSFNRGGKTPALSPPGMLAPSA